MTRIGAFGFLLALLAGLATPPAAAAVKDAEAAMTSGRYAEAVQILTPLVASGDRDAETLMGGLRLSGLGVDKDLGAARDLFTAAAQKGQPFAQYNLAIMHHYGDAGGVDLAAARRWYTLAAEGGMPQAMSQAALLMVEGQGGPKDPDKARFWAERAANAGDPMAMNIVGVLIANGQGGPADLLQGYVWLLLADRSGFKPAQESLEILKHRLTTEERTKAEQAADAWRPTAQAPDRR